MVLRELFAKMGLQTDAAQFNRAEAMLGGLKRTLVGLGVTLTAGAVFHGLKSLVDRTADAAFQSSRAAARLGLTAEAYDELAFAASHAGVPVEMLEHGLKFLQRAAFSAANGNHMLRRSFNQLGVNPAGKTPDQLLMALAAGFQHLDRSDPRRVGMAMQFFGREGIRMLNLFDQGPEKLREFREEAHRLGLVFSDEDRDAALAFRQATITLHATLEALQRAIGIRLMRTLADGKRAMTAWIQANREWILTRVVQFVQGFIGTLQALISMAQGVTQALIDVGKQLGSVRGLFLALAALGAVVFAPVLTGLALVAMALEEVWGWVTGKRKKTLLGELFGPFDKFKESFNVLNPEDSGLVIALKLAAQFAVKAYEATKALKDLLFPKDDVRPANPGEIQDSYRYLLGRKAQGFDNPLQRWIYMRDMPGFEDAMRGLGPPMLSSHALGVPPLLERPGGGSGNVNQYIFGDVHAADPEDFVRQVEQRLDARIGAAHRAVVR